MTSSWFSIPTTEEKDGRNKKHGERVLVLPQVLNKNLSKLNQTEKLPLKLSDCSPGCFFCPFLCHSRHI